MKLLSKRNIIIAVSVLLVLAIAVPLLIIEPWNTTELTEKKRMELIDSLEARENGRLQLNPGTGNMIASGGGYFYYGTYNGYDAVAVKGQLSGLSMRLGDEYFYESSSCVIYLHRDGKFIFLEDAYRNGLISDRNLRKVAQAHYDRVARYISARDVYREQGFGERYEGK